jgi:PPK2 family polyphosphate:nucleotide phosphotransferase
VAKSGGKGEGKRGSSEKRKKHGAHDKHSADEKRADKKAAKKAGKKTDEQPGKARAVVRADGPTKLKSVKLKRAEGTQRLVEQVAAEIVIAELDRAAALDSGEATHGPNLIPQSVETVKAARKQAAPKEAAKELGDERVSFSELLRAPATKVDLAAIDPGSTPGAQSRDQAEDELPKLAARLEELQERLFAAARGGDSKRRVLLVLQGMDTSGKGGTVRHVVGQLDPNGTRLTAFKAPTEEERAHDFLWRIRKALPVAGEVGIFDRSHYEDVLIARVHKLALPMNIGRRYQLINRFEQSLVAEGTTLVKCFLHISRDEQKQRLLARLDDPAKHWKYNPGDVDERELWPEYQEAYRIALEKCSTETAPWYVVPADHKWYRNYAITRLLVEALERVDPAYPAGDFDVEAERERVLAS